MAAEHEHCGAAGGDVGAQVHERAVGVAAVGRDLVDARDERVVAARQQRAESDDRVTGGASVLDESIVELSFLSTPGAVKPGQAVRTSGYSAIYPPGIFVGQVIDTRPVEFGLVHIARVKLAVRMNLLDEVFVMMP